MDSTFNILSFDGGGIRGILSIALLEKIQGENKNVISEANMISGCSTGSLIALGLAYGVSVEKIKQLYSKETSKYIFQKEHNNMIRPKYDNNNLKEVLKSIFPEDLRLGDLNKLVVVPSFYLGSNKSSWKPVFFNNLPDSDTLNLKVIDVAMASSAAPVYFPSYNRYIDGGVVATDPSLASVIYAMTEENIQGINKIRLLSIGTGYVYNSIKEDTTKWGALNWIDGKNPSLPIITVNFEANLKLSQLFCDQLLGENYLKVNPKLGKDVGLDDVNSIDYLLDVANKYNYGETYDWMGNIWNKM